MKASINLVPARRLVKLGCINTLYDLMRPMIASFNSMSIRHGACCPMGAQVGTNFTLLDQAIAGHPVAPGFSFEYLGLKGDLEFKRDALGHQETHQYYACAHLLVLIAMQRLIPNARTCVTTTSDVMLHTLRHG